MIDTKLILIEGPPGSGKSTTAQKLADEVAQSGHACQCFSEWSPDHPIPIGDDLHLGQAITTSIAREGEMRQLWDKFARARQSSDLVTIMESRFWQTSVMLMYIAGHPIEGVLESNRRTIQAVHVLNPVLICFTIDHLRAFVERTLRTRDAEWQQAGYPDSWSGHIFDAFESQKWFIDRGLTGSAGMIALLEEWAAVSEKLYEQFPFAKIQIRNPYLDWNSAMRQMRSFIELDLRNVPVTSTDAASRREVI